MVNTVFEHMLFSSYSHDNHLFLNVSQTRYVRVGVVPESCDHHDNIRSYDWQGCRQSRRALGKRYCAKFETNLVHMVNLLTVD